MLRFYLLSALNWKTRSFLSFFTLNSAILILLCCLSIKIFAQDDAAIRAKQSFDEAEKLFAQKTPAARKDATQKYLTALSEWQTAKDQKGEADTLNRLVEISYLDNEFAKGIDYSEKALAIYQKIGNRSMEAEMLGNISGFYDILGQSRKALPISLKAIEILREIGDKAREAAALNSIGSIYDGLGETEKSEESYNRSLVLRRAVGDKLGEAKTLANLAGLYQTLGKYQAGFKIYEQALTIFREQKDTRTEAIVLNNYGISLKETGEYQKAIDIYETSLELRRQNADKRGEAITLSNIGSVYNTLGDFSRALTLNEQTLKIFQIGNFKYNEATTLSSMAAIYNSLGDTKKALESYQKSLEIRHSINDKVGEASTLSDIGAIYLEQGETTKSLEYFTNELNLLVPTQNKEKLAYNYIRTGRVYETLKNYDQALDYYQKSLVLNRETGRRDEIAESLYNVANVESATGQLRSALENIQEAVQLNETLRRNISSANLQSNYLAKNIKIYLLYIDILMKSHKVEPAKGFDQRALQISETARARSLLDSLGANQSEIRSGLSSDLFNARQNLIQKINAKEFQRISVLRQKQPENVKNFESEIAELIPQLRDVEAKIRQQSPQFATLTQINPPTLTEIQSQLLDENTVLLEYSLGTEHSYLFAVSKNDFKVYELASKAEIEKSARKFYTGLRERGQNIPDETLTKRQERLEQADNFLENNAIELSRILLAPVAQTIKNKRVLIVASDILQYISFAALPNPLTQQANLKTKNQLLIETNEIVYLPSVATLAMLRKSQLKPSSNLISVLADPVFSENDPRVKAVTKQKQENKLNEQTAVKSPTDLRGDLGRLRFSRAEADAIAALVPENNRFIALDFNANVATAKSSNFDKSKIIHFSTHGFVRSDFPELSGVVLSLVNENGEPQDGFLRLYDIYNLNLNAELVVLSACETALGKDIKGEGLVGLTHGFLTAGSKRVIASLWRVDDRATAELMRRFYQGVLKDGLRPANALRKAQISLIQDKNFNHPFYWAAFTLQGDYR